MYETLVTHYESPLYMAKQICEDAGISEAKFREIWNTTDEDRTLGKKTLEVVIEEILRKNNRYSRELFQFIIEKRKKSKAECFEHLHPEIVPMLSALKEKGIRIGLITNCYFEERDAIRDSILYPYFQVHCMSCELGIKKPDPEIFYRCMQDLKASADECIYVGDGGSSELEAARAVGMHAIQATWYFKEGVANRYERKESFVQAASLRDILSEIEKHNWSK